jgi:hypothetical protein
VVCALLCLSFSYVWWCPTAIVVCFVLFAFVLCMVVSNSYCGVCFVLFGFVLCMVVHTTLAVGHHHTQEEEKQNKTHTTIAA